MLNVFNVWLENDSFHTDKPKIICTIWFPFATVSRIVHNLCSRCHLLGIAVKFSCEFNAGLYEIYFSTPAPSGNKLQESFNKIYAVENQTLTIIKNSKIFLAFNKVLKVILIVSRSWKMIVCHSQISKIFKTLLLRKPVN